jgi:predicted GNAT family N-acyltransferase
MNRAASTARRITAEETYDLRHAVLRPGRARETVLFAGDHDAGTSHWGSFTDDGRLAAIATLMRAPLPEGVAVSGGRGGPAWQIRGMASSSEARGRGYGSAVLSAALAYAGAEDPRAPVWCNARVVALDFYRAHGFETVGAEFEVPGVGPHYVMVREPGPLA